MGEFVSLSLGRVLCISTSGIGNTIMFTPFLAALKRHRPSLAVDLLTWTHEEGESLRRSGLIDTFFHFPRSHLGKLGLLLSLRSRRYDCSVTAFPSNRWHFAVLSFAIGARDRVVHGYAHGRLRSLSFLFNRKVSALEGLHDVENNLRLLDAFGLPAEKGEPFFILDAEVSVDDWLASEKIPQGVPIAGVHAGAGRIGGRKKWGLDNFAREAKAYLNKEPEGRVVLFGGPEELEERRELSMKIASSRVHIFEGSLAETAACIARCSFFVSNDTGLMHVAAAFEIPQKAVFVATNPTRTRPRNELAEVVDLTDGTDYPYPFRSCVS